MKVTVFKCDICDRETDPDEMLHTASGKDICTDCLTNLVDKHFEQAEAINDSEGKKDTAKYWPVAREIPEEELKEIRSKWMKGEKQNQICKEHHISCDRLHVIAEGIQRGAKTTAASVGFDWGKAQALRNAGWSIAKIAKEIGCSDQTVCNHTKPASSGKKKPFEWVDEDIHRLGETDKSLMEEVMADGSD